MIATKIAGALLGIGLAYGIMIAPDLAPLAPVTIICGDAELIPGVYGYQVHLSCRAGDAPVVLFVPEILPP